MNKSLATYTERCARIAAVIEPYIDVSRLVNRTGTPNPLEYENGLACKWVEPETPWYGISVFIRSHSDVAAAITRHRNHVNDYALRGEDSYDPGTAREEPSDRDGEYIFIFEYVDDIKVIVGHCEVSIVTDLQGLSVSDLVQPALEIGRTVGCSPYENDFVPPEVPDKLRQWGWTAFGSPPLEDGSTQ